MPVITDMRAPGKTYLASWIVDKAKEVDRTLYVFASHVHSDTRAISIIHSLLFQLGSEEADLLAVLADSSTRDLKSNTKVGTDTLMTALKCAGTTFIVIDGLDEVEDFERKQVLYLLVGMLKDCPEVRICISSRIEVDIDKIIGPHANSLRVDSSNTESIQMYVELRFKSWMEDAGFEEQAERNIKGLMSGIVAQAKGKFTVGCLVFIPTLKHLLTPLLFFPRHVPLYADGPRQRRIVN